LSATGTPASVVKSGLLMLSGPFWDAPASCAAHEATCGLPIARWDVRSLSFAARLVRLTDRTDPSLPQ
jgi:hypothetical protein